MLLNRLLDQVHGLGLVAGYVVATVFCLPTFVSAQQQPPTVYGATGRPYGPTQAEYQYRLQYGRPSPGSYPGDMNYVNGYPGGGSSAHFNIHLGNGGHHFGTPFGFGYGYQYQSYSSFGPGFFAGTYVPGPSVYYEQAPPPQIGFNPNGTLIPQTIPRGGPDDPLNDPVFQGQVQPLGGMVAAPNPQQRIVDPSTPEQQIRAIRHTDLGDRDLARIKYADAAAHYKNAIVAARDQAIPRLRLALAYTGMSRFADAVQQYKLGLALDPTWPRRAEQLVDLLGDENTMARNLLIHRVANWVQEDIRDPDRLFLLVAVLHQNGDPRSQTVLETAIALSGQQPHLVAFVPTPDAVNADQQVPAPQFPVPPAPQKFGPQTNPTQLQPPPIPMPPDAVPAPSTPAGDVNVIPSPNPTGPALPRR